MSCSGSTSCGMSTAHTYNAIDGTPIRYGSPGSYSQINVRSEKSFFDQQVLWIRYLRSYSKSYGGSAFNTLNWLGHAGAYTCKNGCHGRGRAFDLNYVSWSGYNLDLFNGAHASGTLSVRRRYLAVDSTCRRYFHYVLDGWYNSAHTNHIHYDNHDAVLLNKSSSSDVKYVQAVCNNFNGAGLSIDGAWGTNTQNAYNAINSRTGYTGNPFSNSTDYRKWVHQWVIHGFANVSAGYYKSS